MPGFPVHHQLLELAQTHVHRIGDVVQPAHPLLSPSPPAFNYSQYQSFPVSQFFTSGGQSIGVLTSASVLPMNIQDLFPLGLTDLISLQSKGLSKSLLQHHSSKASILWCSAFFTVQLLYLHGYYSFCSSFWYGCNLFLNKRRSNRQVLQALRFR